MAALTETSIRGFQVERIERNGCEYLSATYPKKTWFDGYADVDAEEQIEYLFRPDTSGLYHPVTE